MMVFVAERWMDSCSNEGMSYGGDLARQEQFCDGRSCLDCHSSHFGVFLVYVTRAEFDLHLLVAYFQVAAQPFIAARQNAVRRMGGQECPSAVVMIAEMPCRNTHRGSECGEPAANRGMTQMFGKVEVCRDGRRRSEVGWCSKSERRRAAAASSLPRLCSVPTTDLDDLDDILQLFVASTLTMARTSQRKDSDDATTGGLIVNNGWPLRRRKWRWKMEAEVWTRASCRPLKVSAKSSLNDFNLTVSTDSRQRPGLRPMPTSC